MQMPPQQSSLLPHVSPFCPQYEGAAHEPLWQSCEQQSAFTLHALLIDLHPPAVGSGAHVPPPIAFGAQEPPQQSVFAAHALLSCTQARLLQVPPAQEPVQQSRPERQATPGSLQPEIGAPHVLLTLSQFALQQSLLVAHMSPEAWQVPPSARDASGMTPPSKKFEPSVEASAEPESLFVELSPLLPPFASEALAFSSPPSSPPSLSPIVTLGSLPQPAKPAARRMALVLRRAIAQGRFIDVSLPSTVCARLEGWTGARHVPSPLDDRRRKSLVDSANWGIAPRQVHSPSWSVSRPPRAEEGSCGLA